MSTEYVKTSWQDGDIITADKMNNIENGIKDAEDAIGELKSSFEWYSDNIFAEYTVLTGMFIEDSTHFLRAGVSLDRTICIHGEADKKYIFHKDTATTVRIGCGSTPTPVSGTYVNGYVTNGTASNNEIEFKTTANNPYIYIQLFADVDSSSYRSISANIGTLMVIPVDKTIGGISENLSDLQELADTKAAAIYETASGEIASFKDGADDMPMKSCVVKMEPVQDLHGYDHPWPAGGGKNLLPAGAAGTFTANNGMTVVSDGKGNYRFYGTSTANTSVIVAIDEVTLPDTVFMHMLNASASGQCALVLAYGETQLATPSMGTVNKIIDVSAGAGGKTINRLRFYINTGNTVDITLSPMLCVDATVRSFSPYSNICPISGRTGVRVTRTGVNVWDEETEPGGINSSDGAEYTSKNSIRAKNYIEVFPSTKYYFACPINVTRCWYDENFNYISTGYSANVELTSPTNARYFRFGLSSSYGTTYNHDVGLNYPATNTEYHAYKGSTYSVNWETEAGTVYGGKLDVTTGGLTVDRVSISVTDYLTSITNNGTRNGNQLIALSVPGKKAGTNNFISNLFVIEVSGVGKYTMHGRETSATVEFEIPFSALGVTEEDPVDVRLSASRQWFTDNPTQFIYEHATPTEIQLTPQEVRTLLGVNNVWSDGGDMAAEYPADTKLYIDQKITEAIAAAMA